MAWMTTGETPTAAKLNETAPGIATAAGKLIVTDGANSIAERTPDTAYVATSESTTSGTYTDLTTSGPAVTVTTGTEAIVVITASISNNTANQDGRMSYAVSGATTSGATVTKALIHESSGTNVIHQCSGLFLETGLTAGSNTFTAKYAASGNTATFLRRRITVIPL